MAWRKWNGSSKMREVNEMYLGLNTLRDGFGIGPLIKNHSEGELMLRDRARPEVIQHYDSAGNHSEAFKNGFLSLTMIIRQASY